jgi:hypothetical protein
MSEFESPLRITIQQYANRIRSLLEETTDCDLIEESIEEILSDCIRSTGDDRPNDSQAITGGYVFRAAVVTLLAELKYSNFKLYYLCLFSIYYDDLDTIAVLDNDIEALIGIANQGSHGGYVGIDDEHSIRCYSTSPNILLMRNLQYLNKEIPLRIYQLQLVETPYEINTG